MQDMMKKKHVPKDAAGQPQSQKQSKLGLCMRSLVCCKRSNKVRQNVADKDKTFMRKMCPCFGKKDSQMDGSKAWSANEEQLPAPG